MSSKQNASHAMYFKIYPPEKKLTVRPGSPGDSEIPNSEVPSSFEGRTVNLQGCTNWIFLDIFGTTNLCDTICGDVT